MITLEANYSKKIGLPGYSSHQFSVSLKSELAAIVKPSPPTPPAAISTTTSTERTTMPRKASIPTATSENQPGQGSALKTVIEQVDKIRESLKMMLQGFGDVSNALKLAEKEKKAQEKEIETVRASVRRIQSVSI